MQVYCLVATPLAGLTLECAEARFSQLRSCAVIQGQAFLLIAPLECARAIADNFQIFSPIIEASLVANYGKHQKEIPSGVTAGN
jgi:hypothetical protein